MEEQINMHLSQVQTWKRVFFMLLILVIVQLVRWLAYFVILLQLFFVLVSGEKNRNIYDFGRHLAHYEYHLVLFLVFGTETLPFPFSPWEDMGDSPRR